TLQYVRDGDALARTRIEMLDKGHVDITGQQCELHCAQFIERPALTAAPSRYSFVPYCCHFFAQPLIFDLYQAWKKLCNFFDSVLGWLVCCHFATVILAKTRCPDKYLRSLRKRQDRARRMQTANPE